MGPLWHVLPRPSFVMSLDFLKVHITCPLRIWYVSPFRLEEAEATTSEQVSTALLHLPKS